MNDIELSKKVHNEFFVRKGEHVTIPAHSVEEIKERLGVAHALLDSVNMTEAEKLGLSVKWKKQLSQIEESLNELRDKLFAKQ